MNDAHGLPQSVLVLGGTSEIAGAILDRLVARRARTVVLAGRDRDGLERVAARLRSGGADRVDVVDFDAAAEPAAHTAVVDGAFDRWGDFDLVLVAFAVLGDQSVSEEDPAVAAHVASVNYVAAVAVGVAVARRLKAQGHGNLVVLSSVAAERPRRSNFVYASSKAGFDAFYLGLGDALRGTGPRVMVVRPGFVKTKMTAGMQPLPFATTPEAVASGVVRGLAAGDEVVWVPGLLRWVMSALRHLPRPLFRKVAA